MFVGYLLFLRMFQPKEIKSLGTFKVKVILHSEIEAEVNIKVVAAETIQ